MIVFFRPLATLYDAERIQTGFEFKKGRAFAVITGVVIAVDNEQILLDVSLILIF